MRAAVAAWAVLLCSCALLGPSEPDYDYYVLTPASASEARARRAPRAEASLAVEDVSIPAYLDREPIAIRVGEHRVIYSERARWAEPIDRGLERVLRLELARELRPFGVAISTDRVAADYLVALDVQRFERSGDRAQLWARWTLRRDDRVVAARDARISAAISAPTAAATTGAMSRAVGELAEDIADALERRRSRRSD